MKANDCTMNLNCANEITTTSGSAMENATNCGYNMNNRSNNILHDDFDEDRDSFASEEADESGSVYLLPAR